ncbi:MAG: hypothetical protein QM674_20400 [Burkholderiaceae bacterium]
MDAVFTDDQRSAQPGLLHVAVGPGELVGRRVQRRSDEPLGHELFQIAVRVELHHLTDLLGQRHPPDQIRHTVGDG